MSLHSCKPTEIKKLIKLLEFVMEQKKKGLKWKVNSLHTFGPLFNNFNLVTKLYTIYHKTVNLDN